jgi:hypothetical protein
MQWVRELRFPSPRPNSGLSFLDFEIAGLPGSDKSLGLELAENDGCPGSLPVSGETGGGRKSWQPYNLILKSRGLYYLTHFLDRMKFRKRHAEKKCV